LQDYERVVLIFDGDDPDALTAAREDWKTVRASGATASYWQQDETGRWEKKA
jgi:DNA polymerase-3 subunit chi